MLYNLLESVVCKLQRAKHKLVLHTLDYTVNSAIEEDYAVSKKALCAKLIPKLVQLPCV